MRSPLSKTIVEIKPSGIRKFFDIASEKKDIISLGVGEPDFDTPWHIRDEGIYSLEKGRTFYTSNSGLIELRQEISRYLSRRFNLNYDPKTETNIMRQHDGYSNRVEGQRTEKKQHDGSRNVRELDSGDGLRK